MFFSNHFANEDWGHCYARYQDLSDPPPKKFTLSSSPQTFSEFQKALHSRPSRRGPHQAQMAFQTQHISVAHASMLRSLTSYNEFGSHAQCLDLSWQCACAAIRLFHKSGPTDNPANFRPIALSNCEGKIFFAPLGKAMLENRLKNSFFDQRLQL